MGIRNLKTAKTIISDPHKPVLRKYRGYVKIPRIGPGRKVSIVQTSLYQYNKYNRKQLNDNESSYNIFFIQMQMADWIKKDSALNIWNLHKRYHFEWAQVNSDNLKSGFDHNHYNTCT